MTSQIALFVSGLTDVDTTAVDQLGAIRQDQNGTYKYVKFSGTNAVAVDTVMCYVLSDVAARTVDKANTALGAGIAMAAHSVSVVSYGWIKIRGMHHCAGAIGGSELVGSPLTTNGASDGLFTIADAASDQIVGTAYDIGTAATPYVMLAFPD